jgi:hypothetical protein
MAHPRPAAVTALGSCGLAFGLACLAWLALGRSGDLTELFRAAWGDSVAARRLARAHLDGVAAVSAATVPLLLEWALALLLLAAGAGLLSLHRAARRAALFYCVAVIPVQALAALVRVFCLTLPGQPVRIVPIVVNCLVTLFAIGLWGGLFLPEVEAAFAGPPPASPGGEGAAAPQAPQHEMAP